MKNTCKKCLLYESGENVTYEEIMKYISTLDTDTLVNDDVLNKRLSECKKCDNLLSGMCIKCGCYVEVRARLIDSNCPNYNNRKW